jgi:hypothetical protein
MIATNLERTGTKSGKTREEHIKNTKKSYEKQNELLNSIVDLYNETEINYLLNTAEFNYKRFFGRAKNRTLLKLNPKLYKSLITVTEKYKEITPHFNFSARLYIAGELNFDLTNHMCACGKTFLYDAQTQTINTEGNCKLCNKIAISKVSQELFNAIYERLENKSNVYFGSLNYEKPVYLTIEDKKKYKPICKKHIYLNYKHKFLLDFCQDNKVIEFNRRLLA